MVDHTRTLTDLLMVLDTLEFPARPRPSLNPHMPVLTAGVVLPLSVAFLARWVTCHLQAWRMIAGGVLSMRRHPPPCLPVGTPGHIRGPPRAPRPLRGTSPSCSLGPSPGAHHHSPGSLFTSGDSTTHGHASSSGPCAAVGRYGPQPASARALPLMNPRPFLPGMFEGGKLLEGGCCEGTDCNS